MKYSLAVCIALNLICMPCAKADTIYLYDDSYIESQEKQMLIESRSSDSIQKAFARATGNYERYLAIHVVDYRIAYSLALKSRNEFIDYMKGVGALTPDAEIYMKYFLASYNEAAEDTKAEVRLFEENHSELSRDFVRRYGQYFVR